MAGKQKPDWQLRIAAAAAVAIVVILIVEGGLPFVVLLLYAAAAAFFLYILWRAMRAFERMVDAVEKRDRGED